MPLNEKQINEILNLVKQIREGLTDHITLLEDDSSIEHLFRIVGKCDKALDVLILADFNRIQEIKTTTLTAEWVESDNVKLITKKQ